MIPLQGIASDIMHAVQSYNAEKDSDLNWYNRQMKSKRQQRREEQARSVTVALQSGCRTANEISAHTGISVRTVHDVIATMDNVQIIKSVKQFRFKLKETA